MPIHYLDVDDEVTTAVARLRSSAEPHVALVLPAGSRLATSRINFRLLAREAAARDLQLAIVAPETAVRAIAIAAGVPAYATVGSYEEALADEAAQEARERRRMTGDASFSGAAGRRPADGAAMDQRQASPSGRSPEGSSPATPGVASRGLPLDASDAIQGQETNRRADGEGPGRGARAAGEVAAEGAVEGSVDGASRMGARSAGALPVAPRVHEPPRRRRARLVPFAVLLLLVLAAGGAAAYVVLPSAQIVVTPVAVAQGPIQLRVTADPAASSVDEAHLVIPAQQVSLPLAAQGTFPATGQKVTQVAATGSVTFVSNDTIDPVTIPAGTTVATPDGVQFITSGTVVTPRATVNGTTITPGRATTGIIAVAPGPAGNVGPHTVIVVPTRLEAFQVTVDNPSATSGGSRTVTKVISQQDYDAAVTQLTSQIDTQLATGAANPSPAPIGATVIPATATLGNVVTAPAADALVGVAGSSFQLSATAIGSVLAVSEQPLAGLASSYLGAQVPAGWSLFTDSVHTSVSDPIVQDGHVLFTVTAQGERWRAVDPAALLAQVKGRSVAEARTILAQYGEVSITTWPSYVTTIPTLDARVSLTVASPKRAGS